MNRRTRRVGEQVRGELAKLLREDVRDPRLNFVTLTRVEMTPDFSSARIYWSSPHADDDATRTETARGLSSAASFLRKRLAEQLSLKRTPELQFRHDPSLALGSETMSILKRFSDNES